MSRILGLAVSGFGKTTGIGHVDEEDPPIHLEGLDPTKTFIVSVKSKPLPWRNSAAIYPTIRIGNEENKIVGATNADKIANTYKMLSTLRPKRVICNLGEETSFIFEALLKTNFENIVWDDANYIMQDYYMANALKQGWEAPKKIGYFMGKIFDAIEKFEGNTKNIIVLAHPEFVKGADGREYAKFKTTGKMVDEYSTPEGMFDITLVGRSRFDTSTKRVVKEYITNEDEFTSSAKSPIGMFDQLYIPNDLGYVVKKVNEYYRGASTQS